MSQKKVIVEQKKHVLMMELNRPEKRNAFDLEMYRDLSAAYGELNQNPELRCGLLCARGDHFTAGLDLAEWEPFLSTGRFPDLPEQGIDPLGLDEANCVSKPVVMAVQGICYTMGLELLLGTDIRVASNDTRFGQIEVKRGLYPAAGATVRLMDEIGWGNAMRYLLTGDEISAREAWRLGLVQEITAPEKTFESALAIAQKIAKQSPIGIQATLTSSRIARSVGNQAAIKKLLPDLIPIMKSQDFKEGIQSFLERREADFKGV